MPLTSVVACLVYFCPCVFYLHGNENEKRCFCVIFRFTEAGIVCVLSSPTAVQTTVNQKIFSRLNVPLNGLVCINISRASSRNNRGRGNKHSGEKLRHISPGHEMRSSSSWIVVLLLNWEKGNIPGCIICMVTRVGGNKGIFSETSCTREQ